MLCNSYHMTANRAVLRLIVRRDFLFTFKLWNCGSDLTRQRKTNLWVAGRKEVGEAMYIDE